MQGAAWSASDAPAKPALGGAPPPPRQSEEKPSILGRVAKAVTDISKYCQTCWRNARLPADRWPDCTQAVFVRLLERVEADKWGTVLVDTTGQDNHHVIAHPYLVVDVGGNDDYALGDAGAVPQAGIRLLLDHGGNDRYRSRHPGSDASAAATAAPAGTPPTGLRRLRSAATVPTITPPISPLSMRHWKEATTSTHRSKLRRTSPSCSR